MAPSSRYPSATPGVSDQENNDPNPTACDEGKGRAMDPPARSSLPTPTSRHSDGASSGQKRKRGSDDSAASPCAAETDEQKFNRYFDPNQDPEERREIKRKSRALERDFNENRAEILSGNDGKLQELVKRANDNFQHVKQTNDATIDSRLMVNLSDAANKQAGHASAGDKSTGIDVDEFLSKCISFMRNGGPVDATSTQPTQRRRTRRADDSDVDDDEEDEVGAVDLDWELLGRHACMPKNSRPPVPSFLLGPLSVQKKQRKETQRRARNGREAAGRESRPEALTREDLDQSDRNGLTAICTRIRSHLVKVARDASTALGRAGITGYEQLRTPKGEALMKKLRITDTGGPSVFDYVVNPHSFGQTVENLFYVSFLIKEGSCGIEMDDNGLPSLLIPNARTDEEGRGQDVSKHQAILSLDYGTWRDLIKAFDITEPMIPHREEERGTQMGARGWYA
ncbi:hypothetical protein B0A48_01966 [Cryoendolithus antarcticus]|uniref:Non-structural maintenance of chromosomes element 4 n=1 Tax=Cryoendolithus antarcticus TaxID=1507870 RepID=A0A1V8TQS2_9PEZI|nr:hypothetical protein B0A48_01966 [Cryoendolithus antarcticus]